MTRSEKPALVLRNTSLTMRQRLTPAMVFSTMIRVPAMNSLSQASAILNAWPFGFFWLKCQHAFGFIALKAGVFAQRGSGRIGDGLCIGQLLVMRLTADHRAQIDHLVGKHIGQQPILVGMRFFLPTVMGGLLLGVLGALPAAFCAIEQQIRRRFVHQWVVRHRLRVARGCQPHLG